MAGVSSPFCAGSVVRAIVAQILVLSNLSLAPSANRLRDNRCFRGEVWSRRYVAVRVKHTANADESPGGLQAKCCQEFKADDAPTAWGGLE